METKVKPLHQELSRPHMLYRYVVLVVETTVRNVAQTVSYQLLRDFRTETQQFLDVADVAGLARLVDPVAVFAEPLAVVESEGLLCGSMQSHKKQDRDYGSPRAPLSVVAMDSHYSFFVLYTQTKLTRQELVDFMRDIDEGSHGRGLVIRPFVLEHSILELSVVVGSGADVNDEVVFRVVLFEILGHVVDGVAVGLFQEVGGGEGHGDDLFGDVGEIEFLSFVGSLLLGACHQLAHEGLHQQYECTRVNININCREEETRPEIVQIRDECLIQISDQYIQASVVNCVQGRGL